MHAAQREQVAQHRAELVGGRLAHGGEAPVLDELAVAERAEVGLRVAGVDDEEHGRGTLDSRRRGRDPLRRPRLAPVRRASSGRSSSRRSSTAASTCRRSRTRRSRRRCSAAAPCPGSCSTASKILGSRPIIRALERAGARAAAAARRREGAQVGRAGRGLGRRGAPAARAARALGGAARAPGRDAVLQRGLEAPDPGAGRAAQRAADRARRAAHQPAPPTSTSAPTSRTSTTTSRASTAGSTTR